MISLAYPLRFNYGVKAAAAAACSDEGNLALRKRGFNGRHSERLESLYPRRSTTTKVAQVARSRETQSVKPSRSIDAKDSYLREVVRATIL